MALYHFHVDQIKRSAGQSAIASAAYRSGEKLHSEYYGEDSDYTNKSGVICTEILLPPHVPREYADRETLWNAVEKVEKGKKAQLAYSFDISFQNEFTQEENIALARQFLTEHFVSRGMVVDFAIHEPDREEGGIPNPHFHFMCPIRPIEQNGEWGLKQKREYVLDEHGKAYSQKARVSNLKELSDMANYLKANEIYTIEDLESRVLTLKDTVDELKVTMDTETARMKEMRKMPEYVSTLQELKPIVDGLQKIKFDKAKAKYKAEHEKELKRYYAVRRKVLEMFPDGKYDGRILNKQYAELEQTHKETYAKFVAIREEYQRIWHIQSCVERGLGNTEQTHQKKDNRKQEER